MSLESSTEICEALVRHVETTGSEVFEKNYEQDGRIICTVWCMVGPNAHAFNAAINAWLDENGFKLD